MNDLERAKQILRVGAYAFVLVKEGEVVATGKGDGIRELLDTVEQHAPALRGAALADKIVGKAVALVAAYAGISEVYSPLGSQAALQVFWQHGIGCAMDRVVPLIFNKRGDGPCPMERLTLPINTPNEAVIALREFTAQKPPVVTSRA